jgi:hypothetical protein
MNLNFINSILLITLFLDSIQSKSVSNLKNGKIINDKTEQSFSVIIMNLTDKSTESTATERKQQQYQ